MLKNLSLTNLTLKIRVYKRVLYFIVLVLLTAILFHSFYSEISMFHALVMHPMFIIGTLLLLLFAEQCSTN